MRVFMVLCGALSVLTATRSASLKQDSGVASASVGDSVTLRCFHNSDVTMHFSWYRQTFGKAPELLSSLYKYDKLGSGFQKLEKYPRFSVERVDDTNHLHISDVRCSDSAFYFCGSSHSNRMEFGEGIFLSVTGAAHKQTASGPGSETVRPGGSATLNCAVQPGTCEEEHSIYWFKHGSSQGILQSRADPCDAAAAATDPPRRCVYHFQKTNVSAVDAGTYYCAVVSCGEILYGSGGTLLVDDGHPTHMRMLVWLSIGRVLTVLLFVTVCHLACARKGC